MSDNQEKPPDGTKLSLLQSAIDAVAAFDGESLSATQREKLNALKAAIDQFKASRKATFAKRKRVGRLPRLDHTLILQMWNNGKSAREIAEAVGSTPNHVSKVLRSFRTGGNVH